MGDSSTGDSKGDANKPSINHRKIIWLHNRLKPACPFCRLLPAKSAMRNLGLVIGSTQRLLDLIGGLPAIPPCIALAAIVFQLAVIFLDSVH